MAQRTDEGAAFRELAEPTRLADSPWVEPYPDALLEGLPDRAPGPDARYEAREAIALAFVVALQRLPPRQRAALLLRDVLGYRAGEVAEMLGTSETSANSLLQRARATLEQVDPRPGGRAPVPRATERRLVRRFVGAFTAGDVDGVVGLLTADAWLTMPPEPHVYRGPEAIGRFLAVSFAARGGEEHRLLPTRANGQPAFGHYVGGQARGLLVLELAPGGIAALTRFPDTGFLRRFGLPPMLP